MRGVIKLLKPLDYIIILIVLGLSFLPNLITFYAVSQGQTSTAETTVVSGASTSSNTASSSSAETRYTAIVKIDGKEVDRYELSADAPHVEKTYYPHQNQYNIIERDGNRIRVREDNSPDQIAVRTSWIYRPGQVSICLPHNLVIEIHGEVVEDQLVLPK